MDTNPAQLARLLGEVAAATGVAESAEKRRSEAFKDRSKKALAAYRAGADVPALQKATGLSRPGVYKLLQTENGGPLSA